MLYRENAIPRAPVNSNAGTERLLRFEFKLWLLLLPISVPLVALVTIIKCWQTVEAFMRLFHR